MAKYSIDSNTLSGIANAIREKAGTTDFIQVQNMESAIRDIPKGIDTSDANATAQDIITGATAYVNGEKITGEIAFYSSEASSDLNARQSIQFSFAQGEKQVGLVADIMQRSAYDAGSTLIVRRTVSDFGDATAEDVAKGKTFTSAAGLRVTGTKEESSGESGGNFFVTEATLESDHAQKVGKVLCTIPYIGEHINDAGLFVALIRKATDELTLTVPIVMACNSAYLNSSYTIAILRTQYGLSASYAPGGADGYQINNSAGTSMPRVYADSSGNVYILPFSNYSFVAGTYSVIYGIL